MTDSNVNVHVGAVTDVASFATAEQAVGNLSDKIVGFAKFAGAAIVSGSIAIAIQRTADKFNDLGDVVARVGNATVKELDRLGYVAELTGSDAATATASFENLSRTIGEAAQGIGAGAKAFDRLGLSARDQNGKVKTVSELLEEVKGKIEGLSESEKSAYIQRLGLDRSMVGMLTSDTSEIVEQYNKRTEALGIDVDEAARLGAEYNDSIKVAKRGMDDLITAFVIRVLPSITVAIQRVSKLIDSNAGLIKSYVEPISKAISIGADIVTGFITGVGGLFKILGKWPLILGAVAVAWKVLNVAFSASPIGRIIALATGLVTVIGLLIDDFETWKEGGNSLFSDLWANLEKVASKFMWFKDSVLDVLKAIWDIGAGFLEGLFTFDWSNFIDAGARFTEAFKALFAPLVDFISGVWAQITGAVSEALDSMGKAVSQWWDDLIATITGFGKRAADAVKGAISGAGKTLLNGFTNLLPWSSSAKDKTQDALPTSTVNNSSQSNSTVDNRRYQVNQKITVNSPEEARKVASGTNQQFAQMGG